MKNKAFLSILEQLCMILIFAIVAAICLRAFSFANSISQDRKALDQAVIAAQNTAEVLKSNQGDFEASAAELLGSVENKCLVIHYNESGLPTAEEANAHFKLIADLQASSHPLTECARIQVVKNSSVIYELSVTWQAGGRDNG